MSSGNYLTSYIGSKWNHKQINKASFQRLKKQQQQKNPEDTSFNSWVKKQFETQRRVLCGTRLEGHISCYGEQGCCCLLSINPVPGEGGILVVLHSPVLPKGGEFGILVLGCLDVFGRQRGKVVLFWKEWDLSLIFGSRIWRTCIQDQGFIYAYILQFGAWGHSAFFVRCGLISLLISPNNMRHCCMSLDEAL